MSGSPLTDRDCESVVAFVAAQLVRTPKFRGRWQFGAVGDHESLLMAISDPLLRSDVRKVLADIATNNQQILSLSTLPKAMVLLGNMRMVLLKSDDPLGFITSDSPCCIVQYADKALPIFQGLECHSTNVLMPLCPRVVVLFEHSSKPHEMIGLFPDQSLVHEINAMIWNGAAERIVLPRRTLKPEWFSEDVANKLARYAIF